MESGDNSASASQRFSFPPILAFDENHRCGTIKQLIEPGYAADVHVAKHVKGRVRGFVATHRDTKPDPILLVTNSAQPPDDFSKVLRVRTPSTAGQESPGKALGWLRHPLLNANNAPAITKVERAGRVASSWAGKFRFIVEDMQRGGTGLRSPQIGAVHAVHGHWCANTNVATVVMPTGTGKTETMLSLLISACCHRLLVVVPTDALRIQIAQKFLTLGVLKEVGAILDETLLPIVGTLKHRPKSIAEVDEFFTSCNVVITTMQIAGQCTSDVQERMAFHCPYLFIDEAHHIAAETWNDFREKFKASKIVQFTATPFRNDDRPIGGRLVFRFPMRLAQEQGYFRRIQFKPVAEYDPRRSDEAIAHRAIQQLRDDLKNHGHILMARVDSIARARQVFKLYEGYSEYHPVQIHSGMTSAERARVRELLLNGQCRIVVCVDMLGEGFDLPELKIAAFHDVRKSLAVTLQLAGRFTRARADLGDPTFIANIALVDVQKELQKLYTQDADWNLLLDQGGEKAVGKQVQLWDYLDGFRGSMEILPLQYLRPALSTVVYKTRCNDWTPDRFIDGLDGAENFEQLLNDINRQKHTLVIVTARKVNIDWARVNDIFNWDWELIIVIWDKAQELLFINSSSNSGYYRRLAVAVAGEVQLVEGPEVFRCFSGINRLLLQNVGLKEQLGRLIRYVMRAGSDVESGLTEAQRRNAVKANIFGVGFELGDRASVGCSYRGRIWSRSTSNIDELASWCSHIGAKLLDQTVNPDEVLEGTLVPVPVSSRPLKMPICIDWPDFMYGDPESSYEFVVDNADQFQLYNADIRLSQPSTDGDLIFEIASGSIAIKMKLELFEQNGYADCRFIVLNNRQLTVWRRATEYSAESYFYEHPPIIWFHDGSSLEGSSYVELRVGAEPYSASKIAAWDWSQTNIRKESQGINRQSHSIQFHVIEQLKLDPYHVIFDDDDSGEVADVVAIVDNPDEILIDLFHCKYSSETAPGARISDLYEVCGQSQKCIHWVEKPVELLQHMMRREPRRLGAQEETRFERGDRNTLSMLLVKASSCPVRFRVFAVQPGVSQAKVSHDQLQLLGVTENYLMETFKLPFSLIASA